MNGSISDNAAVTHVLEVFAFAALLLSAVGVFGVMSYTVARRAREIGLRKALGASPAELIRWVLMEASRLTVLGALIGIALAAAFARALEHMLFGVSVFEPGTLLAAVCILGAIALLAALLPAWRAAAVDPVIVLGDGN